MKQSQLFTKTRKEAPKDEVAKNAKLLIRAGYINKEMAGVYSYLPLGLRVLNNIMRVIREEMNAIGGQEVALTALQDKKVWEKTGRWSDDVVHVSACRRDVWVREVRPVGVDQSRALRIGVRRRGDRVALAKLMTRVENEAGDVAAVAGDIPLDATLTDTGHTPFGDIFISETTDLVHWSEPRLVKIAATIIVERDGHKAMVIGDKGERIKRIGTETRVELERLMDAKVFIELWVKVRSGWADDEARVRSFGYE